MNDMRFETVVAGSDELCKVVDVGEIDDIETLLVFLFDRPMAIREVWNDEDRATALDLIVQGNDGAVGVSQPYPFSVVAMARSCAATADVLGPYSGDSSQAEASTESRRVSDMSDGELVAALQRALGKVRIYNSLYKDEEGL